MCSAANNIFAQRWEISQLFYSKITLFLAPAPEIADTDVVNASATPSDTKLETFENTDELFNDDVEFLSRIASAPDSSATTHNYTGNDAVISYEVADFLLKFYSINILIEASSCEKGYGKNTTNGCGH